MLEVLAEMNVNLIASEFILNPRSIGLKYILNTISTLQTFS